MIKKNKYINNKNELKIVEIPFLSSKRWVIEERTTNYNWYVTEDCSPFITHVFQCNNKSRFARYLDGII
jgi:hypothetical protein